MATMAPAWPSSSRNAQLLEPQVDGQGDVLAGGGLGDDLAGLPAVGVHLQVLEPLLAAQPPLQGQLHPVLAEGIAHGQIGVALHLLSLASAT